MRWDEAGAQEALLQARSRIFNGRHTLRDSTPLRLDLGMGGLSDLPPVDLELGGHAVSMPILLESGNYPMRAAVRKATGNRYRFVSNSAGIDESWESLEQALRSSRLPLVPLTLSEIRARNQAVIPPLEIAILSGVEQGTGLGGSGAVLVAVIGAIARYLRLQDVAWLDIALAVEARLGSMGGWEDIAAAASRDLTHFKVESGEDVIIAEPLDKPKFSEFLASGLLLVRTTNRRAGVYGNPLTRLFTQYLLGATRVVDAINKMSEANLAIWSACLREDIRDIGRLSGEQWRLWSDVTDDVIGQREVAKVLDLLPTHTKVLGSKLCGAGSAGYVLLFVDPETRNLTKDEMESRGWSVVTPRPTSS
jgi:galactokinase/mevalonate kinase-like predicted kinase